MTILRGSILPPIVARKISRTDGVQIAPDKSCLVVPVVFTQGKSTIKKGDTFRIITQDRVASDSHLLTVQWNPALMASCSLFTGTAVIGPGEDLEPLRGFLEASREINLRELKWLAKLWVIE